MNNRLLLGTSWDLAHEGLWRFTSCYISPQKEACVSVICSLCFVKRWSNGLRITCFHCFNQCQSLGHVSWFGSLFFEDRANSRPLQELCGSWPALTLLQSNCAWACLSYLIYRMRPIFLNLLITFLITIINCSLVPLIYRTVADFSTALYADFVCCCLPEFKVNPPQTVTMMSALRACAGASVPYWSPPLPTVPGSTKHAVLEYGTKHSQ